MNERGVDSDVTDWLLDSKDPSLRYRVLTDLLGEPADGGRAKGAQRALMETGPVARILSSQQPGGHWGQKEEFYVRSKYRGTVWNLILLADLAADPADERVRKAGDFILRWSRCPDGGFTYRGGPDGGKGGHIACLDGNMVSSLVRLGLGTDPRLIPSYDHIVHLARKEAPLGRGRCVDCRTGLVKTLKGFDMIPTEHGPLDRVELRAHLAEEIASLCLPGGKGPRPDWTRFGFPLMWNTDLIEIIDLVSLPRSDPRVASAVDLVMGKRDSDGKWRMESGFGSRCLTSFGRKGAPSEWTTYRALSMLKRLRD